MKKAERLLDLVAYLLNQHEPVTFEEIQHAFADDYAGDMSEEAIARKFERDKADIIKLGLPLKLRIGEQYAKEGYVIERKSYGLPPIDLGPEELAMLYLAGSATLEQAASPFERDLVLALNKIGFASSESDQNVFHPPRKANTGKNIHSAGLRLREHLAILRNAIAARKHITMSYHGLWKDEVTTRKVDSYGLGNQHGTWVMVGFCHLRQAIRVFHVERIRALAQNPIKPKSPDFDFPDNFVLADHIAAQPWLLGQHEPICAQIRFEAPVAQTIEVELGPWANKVEKQGEARVLHIEATYLDGLLPLVLCHRNKAQVLAPPELIDKIQSALDRIITSVGEL